MKHEKTVGIVLGRTNFGEADRILTVLTSDSGKLRLIAKGVRKEKSKLAGGVELFSTTNISFIPGKRDIGTLVSSRLLTHYRNIVKEINRTMLGYELLKQCNQFTEDECEPDYFTLLDTALAALNDVDIPYELVSVWFTTNLLHLLGHSPNLKTDAHGSKLQPGKKYQFDFDSMCFIEQDRGVYSEQEVKLLRLLRQKSIKSLGNIENVQQLALRVQPLLKQSLELSK